MKYASRNGGPPDVGEKVDTRNGIRQEVATKIGRGKAQGAKLIDQNKEKYKACPIDKPKYKVYRTPKTI